MADADIFALFGGAPTATQEAQALAEAMRRRREAAGVNRGLAMVTSLGANPLLAGLNRSATQAADALGQEAGQGESMLAQAGGQGAGRALQEALAARQQAFQSAENEENRALRERELRESAAARREDRIAARTARESAAAEKKQAAADALMVPGLERPTGGPGITPADAGKMREAVEAEARMEQLMAEAGELKGVPGSTQNKGTGREVLPFWNADRDLQKGAATNLLLGLKGLEATGALDAGTVEVATPLIPGPSDSAESAAAKLNQLKTLVKTKVEAKAKSLGYRRMAPATPPPAAGVGATPAPANAAPREPPATMYMNGVRHVRQADGTYVPG